MQTINERVAALRQWMTERGLQAFITPSTDPHQGEYVPDHWKCRAWISGFTGSAGTAVVTACPGPVAGQQGSAARPDSEAPAALWTDNRYFLQAADQLAGTPFALMKLGLEGTPTIEEWLARTLSTAPVEAVGRVAEPCPPATGVGVDARCWSCAALRDLETALAERGMTLRDVGDPYDELWTDRPPLPDTPVEIHPLQFAGESARSKIERIRHQAPQGVLLSALDEVAWTLNLRGADVAYNPVFVSYLRICPSTQNDLGAILYINERKLTPAVRDYLRGEGVEVAPYEEAPVGERVDETPVRLMKCLKNETEIEGYRSAMVKDGIAMVKWMKWVGPAVRAGGQTELSLSARLDAFRAGQPLFRGPSFGSIMGYGPHAAIVHYEPTAGTDIPVEPRGLLLIDSGGQYSDGTTDITRTIPLGPLTDEERRDYTLVLRGFIDIGRAVFPRGTYGSQLDVLARAAMWQYGTNYLHGTGHGVGSYLNVHEGPHQFRMNYMPTPLLPGMTITDEPGIYIAGSHGVRHENTMLVVAHSEGRTFGPYYTFEHLTLCPIPTGPVIRDMLTGEERTWLNQYHRTVYERLAPHLDKEHAGWLLNATQPI